MSTRRGQDGQVIAIYAISLLLIAFMTFLTLAIGVRVREKIKVESAADAAAYGLAVSQARMMNTMALANRAIVAEYVSMLSVVGHESFINEWEQTVHDQGNIWGTIEGEYAGECGICWLIECFCPACECLGTINDIRNVWQSDGFTNGSGCPGGSGGLGSYDCAHSTWHSGSGAKGLHTLLTVMDNGYVGAAGTARQMGTNAYLRYLQMIADPTNPSAGQTYAEGLGKGIDPAMVMDAQVSAASVAQMRTAVQAYPSSVHPTLDPIADPDWDSYHEILTGTRTDWILNHDFADGFFDLDVVKEEMDALQCGAYVAYSDASEQGGGMVMKGDTSRLLSVNQGHDHHYNGGDALGEGGRHAASAEEDNGTTESFMAGGGCAGGYDSSSSGLGAGDNYMFQAPHIGCDSTTYHKAGDGSDDGDSNSGAGTIWSYPTNGIANFSCSAPGPGLVVGWFRFNIANDASEAVLFNQPRTFASLKMPVAKGPWDFDLDGKIGGSILGVDASKDPYGNPPTSAREAGSISGKAYTTRTFPNVHGFSSGLTYYHNPLDWREVPNLWNPFWRAKLDRPFNSHLDLVQLAGGSPDDLAVQNLLGAGANGAKP